MDEEDREKAAVVQRFVDDGNYHFLFKVVVLGDPGVGKTSFILKHVNDGEQSNHKKKSSFAAALEHQHQIAKTKWTSISFHSKLYEDANKYYRVQYWDAPGSHAERMMTSRLCGGATGAIFMYDVTNRSSFTGIKAWMKDIEKRSPVFKILVGNKVDLEEYREVSLKEGRALAQDYAMSYIETSAVRNHMVDAAVEMLLSLVIATIPEQFDPDVLLQKSIRVGKNVGKAVVQPTFVSWKNTTTEADWVKDDDDNEGDDA